MISFCLDVRHPRPRLVALAMLIATLALSLSPAAHAASRSAPSASAPRSAGAHAAGYCVSSGGSTQFESIQDVTWEVRDNRISFVATIFIANPTGCSVGLPCPEYDDSPEFVNGWVDWNGDEQWDPAERVFDLALTGYAGINYAGTMTGYAQAQIPEDHVAQPRLRVNLGWDFDPDDPCTPSWVWGDVRDFTIDLGRYNVKKLTDRDGNEIREIADRVIWEEAFDGDCKVTPVKVGFDALPFSGARNRTVTLRAEVERCPAGGAAPTIECRWSIPPANAAGGLDGTVSADAWTLDVPVGMPNRVGIYEVVLNFKITSPVPERAVSRKTIRRKLFVTFDTPIAAAPINGKPRLKWYEKACDWASIASFEENVVLFLRRGGYTYGGGHWRYGYNFGAVGKCTWDQLVEDDPCNYSDCYVFSDVLRHLSGTLGVAGFVANNPRGANGRGFVTSGAPSLDPAFRGNAKPVGGAYDRYWFSSHSLLEYGTAFHDATFNGEYATNTAFISWNVKDNTATPWTTDEGATLLDLGGTSYDGWGDFEYAPPAPGLASGASDRFDAYPASSSLALGSTRPRAATAGLTFTGATFSPVDADDNGFAEALAVDAHYSVTVPGSYVIRAILRQGGAFISQRPRHDVSSSTRFTHVAGAGLHTVRLEFSGEDIFSNGADGSFQVHLMAGSGPAFVDSLNVDSPSYARASFGEVAAAIAAVADAGVDLDSDTRFDVLRVTTDLAVRMPGAFSLSGAVFSGARSLATASRIVTLGAGTSSVTLDFSGRAIRKKGVDGPYVVHVAVLDSTGADVGGAVDTTAAYTFTQFETSFLEPTGTHGDLGVDFGTNSLFDVLRVSFEVLAEGSGAFALTGWLAEPDSAGVPGPVLAVASAAPTLVAGAQTLTLDFPGPSIYVHGENGPFVLAAVELRDATGALVDALEPYLPTQVYAATDFEPGLPILTYQGNPQVGVIDSDADLLSDFLSVAVTVTSSLDAVLLGTADLYDDQGRFIVTGTATPIGATAGVPTDVEVRFDGRYVFGNLRDGPFHVRDAYLYPSSDIGRGVTVDEVGSTPAYAYTSFEPAAVVTGTVEAAPGVPAVGAEVRSLPALDYVDGTGRYRLILLAGQSLSLRAQHDPGMTWKVFHNRNYLGVTDSAIVVVEVGVIDTIDFLIRQNTDVSDPVVRGFALLQNTPNPFAAGTEITFTVPKPMPVYLRVYDVRGRVTRTLLAARWVTGRQSIRWDGTNDRGHAVARGIYYYELATPEGRLTRRMSFVR